MWNGFWCYRYLLWNLVSRDFKLKYRRSVLGVVWSVLNPLLMCLVYWAVFSSLMDMRGSGIDNFAVFLMCGQLLFNFFNEATSTGMSSVLGAAPLLKKVYIPKYIFPLEKCCFAMVNCVFSFVALLLVMIFTGAPFHLTLIEAVYPLVRCSSSVWAWACFWQRLPCSSGISCTSGACSSPHCCIFPPSSTTPPR